MRSHILLSVWLTEAHFELNPKMNTFDKKISCHESKRYYRAKTAQKAYEETLTNSRSVINMTHEELKELNELISPLVLKCQPLSHIFFSIYVIQFLILHIIIRMQVLNIFMRIISIRVRLYHGNRYVRTMIRYSLVIV